MILSAKNMLIKKAKDFNEKERKKERKRRNNK
jgi:hypothetical protein